MIARMPGLTQGIRIRHRLEPGDLGAIIALHGRLIPPRHGLDSTHEGYVAASVARHAIRGWPGEREFAWIVERNAEVAGCIALTDDGEDTAGLRWFVLEPALRGRRLGRRLVGELVAKARAFGYVRVRLETFSDLRAAAHLYREVGFRVVHEETGPRWGREQVTYQHYELNLSGRRSYAGSATGSRSASRGGAPSRWSGQWAHSPAGAARGAS
jgi:N-acetylglutamate synthase-like GNAT family acetyltransferase